MKVRVKASQQDNFIGFIDHARRRPGDVFNLSEAKWRKLFPGEQALVSGNDEAKANYDAIKNDKGEVPQEYSFKWMEPVEAKVAEKISTAQSALTERVDTIKAERAAARSPDAAAGGAAATDVI